MIHRVALVLSLAPLTALVSAQSDPISPIAFRAVEAESSNPNPFGISDPLARYLQIHEDLPTRATLITGLAFRRNSDTETYPAFSIDMAMEVSIPVTTAAAPNADFVSNHGRVRARAVARRIVNFPGSGPSQCLPQPFDYRIDFDAPFRAFDRFCWDVTIFGRTNASQIHFDQVATGTGQSNPNPSALAFGTGCFASRRSAPFAVGGTQTLGWASGTGTMFFTATNGPSSSVAIAAIGFGNTSWSGVPLPFAVPGSAAGRSGPCFVQNDIMVTLAATTSPSGTFSSPPLPLVLNDRKATRGASPVNRW